MAEKETSRFDKFAAIGAAQAAGERDATKAKFDPTAFLTSFKETAEASKLINKQMSAKINENKAKVKELLKKFPGGISVPKVDEAMGGVVGDFVKNQRQEYAKYANIVAKGSDADGYDEAVGQMNIIENNLKNVNQSLELFAKSRAALLDNTANDVEYANSTNKYQLLNASNIESGDYEALQPQIIYDDNGKATLTFKDSEGERVGVDKFKLPGVYNREFQDQFDEIVDGVQDLKENKPVNGKWEDSTARNKIKRSIEKIAENEDVIKDYIFQNEDILDNVIANYFGKDKNTYFKDMTAEERDEVYEQFRQEGKIGKQEFINIAMQTIDNTYNSSKTYEEKKDKDFPPTPINDSGSTTEFNDPENPNELTKEEIEKREKQMIIENIKNNPNAYEISDEELENIDNLSLKELESITPSIRILTQNIANRDAQLDRQ
tara:strand:- start:3665 stop:4969 length:1305 start_codon:yes stop_codon:yes gene_type:complete